MTRAIRQFGKVVAAVVLLSGPMLTLADANDERGERGERGGGHRRRGVPEFDASSVGAIAALIGGGGILLARRRKS